MIYINLILGFLLGILITFYVDYKYVKIVCDKCFIDFKNFTHFYKMRNQNKRHCKKLNNKKVNK